MMSYKADRSDAFTGDSIIHPRFSMSAHSQTSTADKSTQQEMTPAPSSPTPIHANVDMARQSLVDADSGVLSAKEFQERVRTAPAEEDTRGRSLGDGVVDDLQSPFRTDSILSKTPTRRTQNYNPRDIPARTANFHSDYDDHRRSPTRNKRKHGDLEATDETQQKYSRVLRSELSQNSDDPYHVDPRSPNNERPIHHITNTSLAAAASSSTRTPTTQRFFQYSTPLSTATRSSVFTNLTPQAFYPTDSPLRGVYTRSPLKVTSQALLEGQLKSPRHISKTPYKVLDAPELEDDYYLNLVDWSKDNMLGVGLGTCVYLWNAGTSRVTKLCDLAPAQDAVTSVSWMQKGTHVAVGTSKGLVQLWDVQRCRKVHEYEGHTARVGVLAWNSNILSSGSRDRHILHRDIRQPNFIRKLDAHRLEVCGLRWNPDTNHLASGGNDNRLFIWDKLNAEPQVCFKDHVAAVKAIAWCPYERGLLASGGGTLDRKIRFWNVLNNQPLSSVDTGSQVCNLAWSRHSPELVSTHGYSQNQIVVWRIMPEIRQLATLTGHTRRVLYLAGSPDGQSVVTGAGDQTLRFWNVFDKTKKTDRDGDKNSSPFVPRTPSLR
ncbi:WD40-repeat-containing domain protein [Cladochytrium replicatum]|nr:WD40-repeat-containing domain protein [Cladochytrium replicatum]